MNLSASLAMSTSVLKALPGKLDIKKHLPGILFIYDIIGSVREGIIRVCPHFWRIQCIPILLSHKKAVLRVVEI